MQNATQTGSGLEVALAIWHRRKWPALLVLLAALSVTIPMVRSLPNVYESTATMVVERQRAPERPSWVVDELETRLRTISQEIMSRSRLYELIKRFNLYPGQQNADPGAVAEYLRRNIRLQFNGVRQPTGMDTTIAFTISYRGRDPETVAQVTNALAALYVEENAKQTTGTTEFLRVQLEGAKRQLEGQERRISEFKQRHIGELPGQQDANFQALGRLSAQVVEVMRWENALATRLLDLPGTDDAAWAQLAKLRRDLADLRARYTDEHPDVLRVQQEIAALEGRLAAAKDSAVRQPKDPRVVSAEAELAVLRNQEQALRRTIAVYEQRVESNPGREQEQQQLSRDYEAAKEQYQALLQRFEGAQLADRMEQSQRGEQFRILDPAIPSPQPVGPHRSRLLLMALLVGMGAAVGTAVAAETRDTSFHTVDDVRAFTSVPVLVSIPPIVTERDVRRRRRQFGLAVLATALGIVAVVGVSLYLARFHPGLIGLLVGRF